jgi:hypothetical protein
MTTLGWRHLLLNSSLMSKHVVSLSTTQTHSTHAARPWKFDTLLSTSGCTRPISVYRFPRRALALCLQLCMGIQPGARLLTRRFVRNFVWAFHPGDIPKLACCNLRPCGTVEDFCNRLHKGIMKNFKCALVWGISAKHRPQRVAGGLLRTSTRPTMNFILILLLLLLLLHLVLLLPSSSSARL